MRAILLAVCLLVSVEGAPLYYDQATYNWDGSLQKAGDTQTLDEAELGEEQMTGAGRQELDHNVSSPCECRSCISFFSPGHYTGHLDV